MTRPKKREIKEVFVIMPFTETPTRNEEQLTSFFTNNIKRPIESIETPCKYIVRRSGEDFNITDQIIMDLHQADIVIADLSGSLPNPNVMYELGVRLSVSEKPVILIREDNKDNKKVFDVDTYFTYPYDPLHYTQLEEHIIGKLERLYTGEEKFVSPVHKILSRSVQIVQYDFSDLRNDEQRNLVLSGINYARDIIVDSYGPLGNKRIFETQKGYLEQLFSGRHLVMLLEARNPLKQRGIQFISDLADEVGRKIGDGTKTSIIIFTALANKSVEAINKGYDIREVINGIKYAIDDVRKYISSVAKKIKNESEIINVATTATFDSKLGALIGEAFRVSGKEGIIKAELSYTNQHEIEIVEDIQFDRGFLSGDFIFNSKESYQQLEDALILIYNGKIKTIDQIIPFLECIKEHKRSFLIIAESVEDEALNTLVLNVKKNVIFGSAVKCPGFGDRRKDILEDISIATGAYLFEESKTKPISKCEVSDLGTAEKIIVESDKTTICNPKGDKDLLKNRLDQIRQQREKSHSDYDRERLQERITSLIGATVVIRIGGDSDKEIRENTIKVEHGLNSANHAVQEGICLGGGKTLLNSIQYIKKPSKIEGQKYGCEAVIFAIEDVCQALLSKTQFKNLKTLKEKSNRSEEAVGVDLKQNKLVDLYNSGIIEPTEVLNTCLKLVFSYLKTFIEISEWATYQKPSIDKLSKGTLSDYTGLGVGEVVSDDH